MSYLNLNPYDKVFTYCPVDVPANYVTFGIVGFGIGFALATLAPLIRQWFRPTGYDLFHAFAGLEDYSDYSESSDSSESSESDDSYNSKNALDDLLDEYKNEPGYPWDESASDNSSDPSDLPDLIDPSESSESSESSEDVVSKEDFKDHLLDRYLSGTTVTARYEPKTSPVFRNYDNVLDELEDKMTELEDDVETLFEKEQTKRNRTRKEIIEIGLTTGREPTVYFANQTGGYVTHNQYNQAVDEWKSYTKVSESDARDIIEAFSEIVGMSYDDARERVAEDGYELWVNYVNREPNNDKYFYSGNVLGVRIEDPGYSYITRKISDKATILEICNVGGKEPEKY